MNLIERTGRNRFDLVPRVIRMPLQNRERSINLLQQNHARQFMRQRHLPQRDRMLRRGPRRFAESVRAADRE